MGHAHENAGRWWQEEDACTFDIGCADFELRPVMIYAIEVARLMCGASRPVARKAGRTLLRMALKELERDGSR